MADIKKLIEEIKTLTLLETSELVKALEEEFGVSAAAPVAVAAAPAAGAAAAAPAAEEKTEFNVVLKDAGAKKIDVIKVVRAFTGLGLVEAKSAVEKGGVLKENVAKEEADKILADLKLTLTPRVHNCTRGVFLINLPNPTNNRLKHLNMSLFLLCTP